MQNSLAFKVVLSLRNGTFLRKVVIFFGRRSAHKNIRQISGSGSDLLIIGPGEMRIPNNGWGAVEYLIQKQMVEFKRARVDFTLLNSWSHHDWFNCFVKKPKIILLHYDLFSRRCFFYRLLSPRSRIFVVSHYGYSAFPKKYDSAFPKILKWSSKLDGLIVLSRQIMNEYRNQGIEAPIYCVPNAVDSDEYKVVRKDKEVIYLGKVETRKMQFEVANSLNPNCEIDFVGPIVDPRVEFLSDVMKIKFKGPWERQEVLEQLSRYKVLVLFSDGEADALVLHEAQAAGCSIVVSRNALGSQDSRNPWIYVTENVEDLQSTIDKAIKENDQYCEKIRDYAVTNLTWKKNVSMLRTIFDS